MDRYIDRYYDMKKKCCRIILGILHNIDKYHNMLMNSKYYNLIWSIQIFKVCYWTRASFLFCLGCFRHPLTNLFKKFNHHIHTQDMQCVSVSYGFFHPWLGSLSSSGMDQAQRVPRVHHVLQAGAAGPPGFPPQVVAIPDPGRGPEHQELQVPTLAEPSQFQQVGKWRRRVVPLRSDGIGLSLRSGRRGGEIPSRHQITRFCIISKLFPF